MVSQLNKYKIVSPSIIFKDNKIYVFISDENNIIQLYYKNFNSNEKFSKITLSPNELFSVLPIPKIFNNNLYLFYQKFINDKIIKIKYYKNIDIQQPVLNPFELTTLNQATFGNFFPEIIFNQDTLYSLWINRYGENNERNDSVYMKTSPDLGQTWSKDYIFSEPPEDVKFPCFTLTNNKIYLSYIDASINSSTINSNFIVKIFDANNYTLLDSKKLNPQLLNYYNLKVTYFNSKFYLFWYSIKNGKSTIYSMHSDDFINWEQPQEITKTGLNNRKFMVINNPKLALIYEGQNNNKSVIYYQEKITECPEPILYSSTHRSNEWSYNNTVVFNWKEPIDTSNIRAFCYLFDNIPDSIPDIECLSPTTTSKKFENIANGIYYFHLRAVDIEGNISPTAHYKIMINNNPPEPPKITCKTHQEFIPNDNDSPVFSWETPDKRPIKGFSFIFNQNKDQAPENKINITKNKIQFNHIKEGLWYFKIMTCDLLNRWSDYSTYTILVEKIIIASKIPENVQSRYSYIVQEGDVLSTIINRVLDIKNDIFEWREYEKPVGKFNYIQNLDFLKPGDIVMFPIIIAQPSDTLETISKNVYGEPSQTNKIVIVGKEEKNLEAGDRIILKDKYFLATGDIPPRK